MLITTDMVLLLFQADGYYETRLRNLHLFKLMPLENIYQENKEFLEKLKHLIEEYGRGLEVQTGGTDRVLGQIHNEKSAKGHIDEIRAVAFSPDGRFLATGSKDRTLRIWNLETDAHRILGPVYNKESATGDPDGINALAFSPDGRFVATGCRCR